MSSVCIAIIICATVLGIAIVVTNTIKSILQKESYWKARYDLEAEEKYNVVELNDEILSSTKDVIQVNRELLGLILEKSKKDEGSKED